MTQTEDWGCTIGDGITWRTLSKAEWQYLIKKGKYKYPVKVCEKTNCLVLVSDDFEGTISGEYDAAAWATAEAAGLVCLPAAGRRSISNVYGVGDGFYWSSSADDDDESSACAVYFNSFMGVYHDWIGGRYTGCSVRLVTECQ